jgi:hypothetical protein
VVVGNVLEGKLASTSFPSWCNIVVGNAFMFVLEGKLTSANFPSQCNFVVGNVIMIVQSILQGCLCPNDHHG